MTKFGRDLDIEMKRKRKFVKLERDTFGIQRMQIALQDNINIGSRMLSPKRPGTKDNGLLNVGITSKHVPDRIESGSVKSKLHGSTNSFLRKK